MRIIITGDSSRGKTTFANKLSERTGIPVTSTDDIYFEKKFTKIRSDKEIFRLIDAVYARESWIVEGTTRRVIRRGLESCDLIVYCGHRHLLSQLYLAFKRGLQRKDERFTDTLRLLAYLFRRHHGIGVCKGKERVLDMLQPYRHKLVLLYSFAEINAFLESFRI